VGEGEDEGAKIKNVHFNITLTSILSHQGRGGKWIPLDTAQLAGRRFISLPVKPVGQLISWPVNQLGQFASNILKLAHRQTGALANCFYLLFLLGPLRRSLNVRLSVTCGSLTDRLPARDLLSSATLLSAEDLRFLALRLSFHKRTSTPIALFLTRLALPFRLSSTCLLSAMRFP
jgi:hypothetical protein